MRAGQATEKVTLAPSLDCTVVEVVIEHSQNVSYLIDNHTNSLGTHAETHVYRFLCKKQSTLTVHVLLTGESHLKIRIEIELQEENAQACVYGAAALTGDAQYSFEIVQNHSAPRTISSSMFKAAVNGNAVCNYAGMIAIAHSATGSDAQLYNKNMLLSDRARVNAVPSLEVLTNNVHCKHGTATAAYNSEQLLYMQSRGIDLSSARALLLKGFFSQGLSLKQEDLSRLISQTCM